MITIEERRNQAARDLGYPSFASLNNRASLVMLASQQVVARRDIEVSTARIAEIERKIAALKADCGAR